MGKVNKYIGRLISFIRSYKYEHEWEKYYGKVPAHLNYSNGSMYDELLEASNKYDKEIAISYFGNELSYRKFITLIDKIASSLKEFDVVENECVTICMPNTPESLALIYAVNKIGAIANIIHPLSSQDDIKRALKEGNSDILFCSDTGISKTEGLKIKNLILVPISYSMPSYMKVLYNIKNSKNLKVTDKMISWSAFLNYGSDADTYVKRCGNDPAVIIYSGGTTGKPKGIIISNLNFNAISLQVRTICDLLRPGSTVLCALPIFHVFGLSVCCHSVLTSGAKAYILPRINMKKINSELKKYHPTVLPMVPSMMRVSLNDYEPSSNAFKDIKMVVCGGDFLSEDLKKDFESYLKEHGSSAVIKQGYGLSEATGFVTCTCQMNEKDVINGTLGVPNPDTDIKIFEPNTDIEKDNDIVGEICINGPTVMMGYINEDKETKKTLVKHSDGKIWLHTGDLGYFDKDGRLYYTSRLKRMIISNGYNIYPLELENIINKHEYVASCTVVGIPHKTKGQTPKAVIVLKPGIENTLEVRSKIRVYCRENIALYAVPSEFEYRTSMPMTSIGKVAYKNLEDNNENK